MLHWSDCSSLPNCCKMCIYSVLQCVAVYGNVLQNLAVCFGVKALDDQIVAIGAYAVCCGLLQYLATCCRILLLYWSHCSLLLNYCDKYMYSVLQCVAVFGNVLQDLAVAFE